MPSPSPPVHAVTRIAHPLRFRRLVVRRVEALAPRMRRIVLEGDDLDGFVTPGFDDHVKLFFPLGDGRLPVPIVSGNGLAFPDGEPRPEARDFTPRRWDPEERTLTIDFGLHGRGPATTWATGAAPGAVVGVGGPRSSSIVSDTYAWNLLIGDETALPAIARRIEELAPTVGVVAVIEVEDDADRITIDARAAVNIHWVRRRGDAPIDDVVAELALPPGEGFAWVAGEAAMARRIRRHLLDTRGFDRASVKASAYWRAGVIGRHEVIVD